MKTSNINEQQFDIIQLKTLADDKRSIIEIDSSLCGGKVLKCEKTKLIKAFYELIDPDEKKWLQKKIADLTIENPVFQAVYALGLPDCSKVRVLEKGKGIYDKDDKLVSIESTLVALHDDHTQNSLIENLHSNRMLVSQMLEGSPIPMFVINNEHKIMYWNLPCERLTGIRAEKIVGTSMHQGLFYEEQRPVMADLILEKDHAALIEEWYSDKVRKSPLLADVYEGEDFYPNLGDHGLWLFFTVKPIRDQDGVIIGAVETVQDITEQRNANRQIAENEERLRYLIENASDIIYTHDLNGVFTLVNPTGLKLFGYSANDILNKKVTDVVDPEHLPNVQNMIQQKLSGDVTTGPYDVLTRNKSNELIWVEVNTRVVKRDNKTAQVFGIARIITERKKSEKLFWALNQASQAMMKQLSEKEVFEQVSNVLQELGYSSVLFKCFNDCQDAQMVYSGFTNNRISQIESLMNIQAHTMVLKTNKVKVLKQVLTGRQSVFYTDIQGMLKEMLPKLLHVFIPQIQKIIGIERFISAPIIVDDKVLGLFSVLTNDLTENDIPTITAFANQIATAWKNASLYEQLQNELEERIKIEVEIEKSLREKEVLLKEIHHRVKNNLQIILSLLNLQSREIDDQTVLGSFQIAKDRIQSMALVHERLYKSEDFASVNFQDYIQSLVEHLFKSYEITGNVELDIKVDDVDLNIDNAIPCGLLINELVTNSLKHAFPNGRKGMIKIQLIKQNDGLKRLIVQDDGIGINCPADELEKHSRLGMNISQVLVRQLNGTFDIQNHQGTKFICVFSGL